MRALANGGITRKLLSESGFPRGAIIGMVIRENEVIVPTGSIQIEAGDLCIIFCFPESFPRVQKLFREE